MIPEDVLAAIKKKNPSLTPRIMTLPAVKNIKRAIVDCGNGIQFNVGDNVGFFKDRVLLRVLKNFPLLTQTAVDDFVQECFALLAAPLKPAPQVSDLARKYLGQETSVSIHPQKIQVWIDYSRFEVFVTADHVVLVGKKTRRALQALRFANPQDLERAFKTLKQAAAMIDQLDQ